MVSRSILGACAVLAMLLSPAAVAGTVYETNWDEFEDGDFCAQAGAHGWSCAQACRAGANVGPTGGYGDGKALTVLSHALCREQLSRPAVVPSGSWSVQVRVTVTTPGLVLLALSGPGGVELYSDDGVQGGQVGELHLRYRAGDDDRDALIGWIPLANPKDYFVAFEPGDCAAGKSDLYRVRITNPLEGNRLQWSRDFDRGGCWPSGFDSLRLGTLYAATVAAGTWFRLDVEQPALPLPG